MPERVVVLPSLYEPAEVESWPLQWHVRWEHGDHRGVFSFAGRASGTTLGLCGNLTDWAGSQPAFLCGGGDYTDTVFIARAEEVDTGEGYELAIEQLPFQFALGVRHRRYLMRMEDKWYPPRRWLSAELSLRPGTYRLSLRFTLFDASHLWGLLEEIMRDFRHPDPFAEVRIMEYHHQILKWHGARERAEITTTFDGPLLEVPACPGSPTGSRATPPTSRERSREFPAPVCRPIRSRLAPHCVLKDVLCADEPSIQAVLHVLTGRRRPLDAAMGRHAATRRKLWKTPWRVWAFGDQGDSLALGYETLTDYWSARLLGRRELLEPHYRVWRSWPYRETTTEIHWPRERPTVLRPRPWLENRPCGDVDLSTTHKLAAACVASWVCGHVFGNGALQRRARIALREWVLPRQELDGFWPYTADRWPGQEGFHCNVLSCLSVLLDFDEWRRDEAFVHSFTRGFEFVRTRLARGDGSYYGAPWRSPRVNEDHPDHLAYVTAFTLHAVEAMAAGVRSLELSDLDELGAAVRWLYRNLPDVVSREDPVRSRLFAAPLRSLLLMPLRGFQFRGDSDELVEVSRSRNRSDEAHC